MLQIDEFCEVITKRDADSKTTDIFRAFRCLDFDNVSSFCFGWSEHAIQAPDFNSAAVEELQHSNKDFQFWKHFLRLPLPVLLLASVYFRIKHKIWPLPYSTVYRRIKNQIATYIDKPEELDKTPHPTVFHVLMDSSHGTRLSATAMAEEASLFLIAGTDTTSNASALGTIFALSDNGYMRNKLKEELKSVWPRLEDKPSLEVLESLPYLKAVCKESLRLSHGAMSPLMRVVPQQGAVLGGHFVPGGTKVGMAHTFVHFNPTLFPEPHTFRPERWLEPGAEALDTWNVAFSKGPRSCLGINLAWCELYMNIAHIFRRFDLKLEQGVQKLFDKKPPVRPYDLWHRDCFLPYLDGVDLLVYATPSTD